MLTGDSLSTQSEDYKLKVLLYPNIQCSPISERVLVLGDSHASPFVFPVRASYIGGCVWGTVGMIPIGASIILQRNASPSATSSITNFTVNWPGTDPAPPQ